MCCENKGADQLRGDHAADLRSCTVQLICAFVFTYARSCFQDDVNSVSEFDFLPMQNISDQPANYVQKKFSVNLGTPRK